jgi:lipid II:glycine glycyltransferase (peptidoglycan interpeptide bridge formation enzyme)
MRSAIRCLPSARYDSQPVSATDGAARLEQDEAVWDEFVAASPQSSYLQSTAWGRIKRANGWHAVRVATSAGGELIGAQLLVRRAPGLPWGFGYVPRGPIGARLDRPALEAFTDRLQGEAQNKRLAYVTVEPELPPDAAGILRSLGWGPTTHVQPESSRVIDLDRPSDEIWNDVHRKARQSVNKARRLGVRVVEADGDRLADFYRIHAGTAERAHFVPRAESSFREMWSALAPKGMARLFFAEQEDGGEAVATLFLVTCGRRAFDLYGGTTGAGDATRANYVLKWEVIDRAREAGLKEYDLWGLPRQGIAQFKSAWGGREVDYVGAWELGVSRIGRAALKTGLAARGAYVRARYGQVPQDGAGE